VRRNHPREVVGFDRRPSSIGTLMPRVTLPRQAATGKADFSAILAASEKAAAAPRGASSAGGSLRT